MLLSEHTERQKFVDQLIQFAEIGAQAFELSRLLLGNGLTLLSREYGGLVCEREKEIQETFCTFEVELIKERYGSVRVHYESVDNILGYRSPYVNRLLSERNILREDLESLSRARCIDEIIGTSAWGERYTREYLTAQRAISEYELVREKSRLADSVNIGGFSVERASEEIYLMFNKELHRLGYRKFHRSFGMRKQVYSNSHRVNNGLSLLVVPVVKRGELLDFPISVTIFVQPDYLLSETQSTLRKLFEKGTFLKMAENLSPGMGRYRIASSQEELGSIAVAYKNFLPAAIPLFEKACTDIQL